MGGGMCPVVLSITSLFCGGNDIYTITAGSYLFDGYLFTAAGTETLSVTANTATNCYLYYHLDANSHIDACGICKEADIPSGAQSLKLWVLSYGNAAAKIMDYRTVLTWGRTSSASTASGCYDLLDTRETTLAVGSNTYSGSYVRKRFRVGYPGSVRIDFDGYCDNDVPAHRIYITRGGTGTLFSSKDVGTASTWESFNETVTGLQPGDYIDIIGGHGSYNFKYKNFRVRYVTADTPSASFIALV